MIHGGGFTFGFGHIYGPDYIIDIPDVVVVTFNYRLGPLGFLTTGDSICPGNNGLKDQTLALEWVQRNIHAFGGDPNKVTIVGLSAGGASVHYHYLSELSEGLFKRGYSFSGSALCPWAFQRDGVEKTKRLAANLGCPNSDSKTMVKCLRRRPARKIVEQMKNFQVKCRELRFIDKNKLLLRFNLFAELGIRTFQCLWTRCGDRLKPAIHSE